MSGTRRAARRHPSTGSPVGAPTGRRAQQPRRGAKGGARRRDPSRWARGERISRRLWGAAVGMVGGEAQIFLHFFSSQEGRVAQQPTGRAETQGGFGWPVEQFSLDNGLRVVVSEDRTSPIAAVNLWYNVGSRHESA